MACDRETRVLISAYADGEVTPQEAAHASEHLQACADCRKMLEDWQGQRQLLEWAYAFELPEHVLNAALESEAMSTESAAPRRRRRLQLGWGWKTAAAVIGVLVLLVAYQALNLGHPLLKEHDTITTGTEARAVRMGTGVRLTVGPGSLVTRTGAKTIRLDRGWMAVSVRWGGGLNVITPRLKLRDVGTVFHVSTSAALDCLTVERGSVQVITKGATYEVCSGQAVFADASGSVSTVGTFAARDSGNSMPLANAGRSFSPETSNSLDWDEGAQRLAEVFPDAKWDGGWVGGDQTDNVEVYRSSIGAASRLVSGVRSHYLEIARAAAGGAPDGEWEIPVGYLLLSGVYGPSKLPGDFYYLRLISDGKMVRWNLTGTHGDQADFPLEMAVMPNVGGGGSVSDSLEYARGYDKREGMILVVRLKCWPGELKPALRLQLTGVPVAQAEQDQRGVLARALAQLPPAQAKGLGKLDPTLYYLDRDRTHRLLVAWNSDAGKAYYRAVADNLEGKTASFPLALVMTDVNWLEPRLPAGVHVVWCTMRPGPRSQGEKEAHLEITSDASFIRRVPLPREVQPQSGGYNSWSPEVPEGRASVSVRMSNVVNDGSGYRFWLQILPEGLDWRPTNYIRIAKP